MINFDYVRPASVADASRALLGANATAIAGGHTLIPTLKQRLAKPAVLVDLTGIAELKGIRRENHSLIVGATTTHAEVASSTEVHKAIPALAKLAGGIGDAQVRHTARSAARSPTTTLPRITPLRSSHSAQQSSPISGK